MESKFSSILTSRGKAGSEESGIYKCTDSIPSSERKIREELDASDVWVSADVNSLARKSGRNLRSASWAPLDLFPSLSSCFDSSIYDQIENFISRIEPNRSFCFGSAQVIRYDKGDYVDLHADRATDYMDRWRSVLVYLNDDFEGGETVFPMQDIYIVPSFGQIVIFPSDFIHESTEIAQGTKYVVVLFLLSSEMSTDGEY